MDHSGARAELPADFQSEDLDIPDLEVGIEIGRGGMGVVFHGRQTYIGRSVAVKLLALESGAGKADFVRRFQREATILAGLTHPNIVACYQAGVTASGRPFLVLEYIDGPSLGTYLHEHGAMPEDLVLIIVRNLALALGHAWDCGVIHRDVKAENVLLRRLQQPTRSDFPFEVKLVDLGLARPVQASKDHATRTGLSVGTPSIMAPEQFDDISEVDFKADIYALGCLMFHMLTGEPAFGGAALAHVLRAKLLGPIPDPLLLSPDLQTGTVALVKHMLARDKNQRPASYKEIIARCESISAVVAIPKARHRPTRVFAILLALAACVVVTAWTLNRDSHSAGAKRVDSTSRPGDFAPVAAASHPQPNQEPAGGSAPEQASSPRQPPLFSADPGQDVPVQATRRVPQLLPPTSLSIIAQWKKSGEAAWDRSETDLTTLIGISGEILHPLHDGMWRLEGVLTLANASTVKTDSASIAILGADGTRYEIAVKNLESTFVIMTARRDPDGHCTTFHTDAPAPHNIRFAFIHLDPRFLAVELDGVPLEHPLGLPLAALPLKAIALRVHSSSDAGHGRLEVSDFVILYAAQ